MYRSTVKVGINADDIALTVDDKQKIVTFNFPEFTIQKPLIDESSIEILPNKRDLFMDELLALCRNDVIEKTTDSNILVKSAEKNLESVIEAWYSSVFEGYSFEYWYGDKNNAQQDLTSINENAFTSNDASISNLLYGSEIGGDAI